MKVPEVIKNNLLSPAELGIFNPLNRLDEKQLILLSSHHQVLTLSKQALLIAQGSANNKEYFLLEGSLKVTASDGKEKIIVGGSQQALSPIAHLQPRKYNVSVLDRAKMLVVEWDLLADFMRQAPREQTNALEAEIITNRSSSDIIQERFLNDLKKVFKNETLVYNASFNFININHATT